MHNKYLKTFLLGDKSNLSTKVMSSYQENGISHLFAISGMHIALLSSLITRFLKKFKVTEEKRYYITSTILIMYLLLVGFSPSILRGVLFYLLLPYVIIYGIDKFSAFIHKRKENAVLQEDVKK